MPASEFRGNFSTIALVEGGPDYLAALHFALRQKRENILPLAILGRGACRQLHRESLSHFVGKRVRIYPHVDPDLGGLEKAVQWARQLEELGCEVDLFRFDGLSKRSGQPVKDLNDCVDVCSDQEPELEALFS